MAKTKFRNLQEQQLKNSVVAQLKKITIRGDFDIAYL